MEKVDSENIPPFLSPASNCNLTRHPVSLKTKQYLEIRFICNYSTIVQPHSPKVSTFLAKCPFFFHDAPRPCRTLSNIKTFLPVFFSPGNFVGNMIVFFEIPGKLESFLEKGANEAL